MKRVAQAFMPVLLLTTCYAQQPLTLAEADQMALQNHPAIRSSQFTALAAGQIVTESRSALLPTVNGSATGVGALGGSRIAAGALNNPIIYDRFASGLTASQLITDFGRTKNLVETARLRAQAENQNTETTRDQVILAVDRTYFSVLRGQAVLTVAEQTVKARQLVVDQVTALVQSKLKSTIDLTFAKVNLADAQLTLTNAQNDLQSSMAELSNALGYQTQQNFSPVDEPLPSNLPNDLNALIDDAIRKRPELASLRLQQNAAEHFARAERDLSLPTISGLATTGYIPVHQTQLTDRYAAAGLNVNIPIFNGYLFRARQTEAEFRAQAAAQNVKDEENRVARDVRVAYMNTVNAYQRLDLTAQLVEQARLGLSLAQSRYDLGLGSIVELSQAQLNETSSEIASAQAKYDYQTQRSILAYQIGTIR